jgi:hypothetical protein
VANDIVSAIFDERAQGERAVIELRRAGANDAAISIVGRPDKELAHGDKTDEGHDLGDVALGGAMGDCTVLGVPGLAIPAIMPLAAAGGIVASAVPTVAAVSAGTEAARGALAEMLSHHEVGAADVSYFEERIRSGSFFVSIDMRRAEIEPNTANDILQRFGGYSSSG